MKLFHSKVGLRSVGAAIFLALIPAPTLAAQAATVSHYGAPCLATLPLTTQGLPQLGATLAVNWMPPPCASHAGAMVLGFAAQNVPMTVPQWAGCALLVSPAAVVPGLSVTLVVPNDPGLIGTAVHVQGVVAGFSCIYGSPFPHDLFFMSGGVRGVVGM